MISTPRLTPPPSGYAPTLPHASALSQGFQAQLQEEMERLLAILDEPQSDARWKRAREATRELALRPAKRLRPVLVLVGYGFAGGGVSVSRGAVTFAAAVELLHTFLLIHDDVADQARLRRGGPALHRLLADGRLGEDLAIVAGDHLFARAMEGMLHAELPRAVEASLYMLAICRQTAIGQYLDLELARAPLGEMSLFQTLRVAQLKTARYGFVAPLVCGAKLGNGKPALEEALERVGRNAGMAFQLRDDLLGLFGDTRTCGKEGDSDFYQGKRTFPVLSAYARAGSADRQRLEELWSLSEKDPAALKEARALVEQHGGRAATERMIAHLTRQTQRALESLPEASGLRAVLASYLLSLMHGKV